MPKVYYNKAVVFVIKCSLNNDMFITSSTGEINRAFLRIKNKAIKQNSLLAQSMIKYGIHNFYVEILERFDDCKTKFEMIASEAKYIKLLKPNLNLPNQNDDLKYSSDNSLQSSLSD